MEAGRGYDLVFRAGWVVLALLSSVSEGTGSHEVRGSGRAPWRGLKEAATPDTKIGSEFLRRDSFGRELPSK
jgi:hypothetical protein